MKRAWTLTVKAMLRVLVIPLGAVM